VVYNNYINGFQLYQRCTTFLGKGRSVLLLVHSMAEDKSELLKVKCQKPKAKSLSSSSLVLVV